MAPFDGPHATYYQSAVVTMALSCIISEIKRDIGQKSRFFHIPLAFDAPLRGSPSDYCHTIWYGKTRMVWLPVGKKSLRICLAVLTVSAHFYKQL